MLAGIGWMVVTGLFFAGVTGIVRHLGSDMSSLQAAFIRYAMGIVLLAPVFFRLLSRGSRPGSLKLYALRGVVHGLGVMLWFYAMARIPIAEVTAIGFTSPIFTVIGAALFLGERLDARRVICVALGFVGTMIILRPGAQAIAPGALAQLCAAPLFACSFIVAKKLTATESSSAIVAYLSVAVTIVLLPPAMMVWREPTMVELGWLLVTAALATAGHYTLARAMRHADLTFLQPFSFLQLVWASLLGLYLFGESLDVWTWIGGGVIVASATLLSVSARRQPTVSKSKPP